MMRVDHEASRKLAAELLAGSDLDPRFRISPLWSRSTRHALNELVYIHATDMIDTTLVHATQPTRTALR